MFKSYDDVPAEPKQLTDVIGNQEPVKAIKAFVGQGTFPLAEILWGPAGTGKTTAALAQVRAYFVKKGILDPNTTLQDIRSNTYEDKLKDTLFEPSLFVDSRTKGTVQYVNTTVLRFLQGAQAPGVMKFVVFDEGDMLTAEAKDAVQPLIERFKKSARFIFTTNETPNKAFRDPIISRASGGVFKFTKPSTAELESYLEKTAHRSGIAVSKDELNAIATNAPGVRDALGQLQTLTLMRKQEAAPVMEEPARRTEPTPPPSQSPSLRPSPPPETREKEVREALAIYSAPKPKTIEKLIKAAKAPASIAAVEVVATAEPPASETSLAPLPLPSEAELTALPSVPPQPRPAKKQHFPGRPTKSIMEPILQTPLEEEMSIPSVSEEELSESLQPAYQVLPINRGSKQLFSAKTGYQGPPVMKREPYFPGHKLEAEDIAANKQYRPNVIRQIAQKGITKASDINKQLIAKAKEEDAAKARNKEKEKAIKAALGEFQEATDFREKERVILAKSTARVEAEALRARRRTRMPNLGEALAQRVVGAPSPREAFTYAIAGRPQRQPSGPTPTYEMPFDEEELAQAMRDRRRVRTSQDMPPEELPKEIRGLIFPSHEYPVLHWPGAGVGTRAESPRLKWKVPVWGKPKPTQPGFNTSKGAWKIMEPRPFKSLSSEEQSLTLEEALTPEEAKDARRRLQE